MARRETAKKASHMQGDKPYQKYACAALPLLVRQAKARKPITYGSLAKELGMPNPRHLNYPLGSIGNQPATTWRRMEATHSANTDPRCQQEHEAPRIGH